MSSGTIIRHECGRLIIYGRRCVCDPVTPFTCDCTADGNREHEGAHCREQRRRVWNRVVNWARDRDTAPPP